MTYNQHPQQQATQHGGIWFQTNTAATSVFNIYNNFIALPLNNQSAQNIIGIDISTAANNFTVNCYYNSIRIGGTHTAGTVGAVVSAGIRSNSAGVTLAIKNNICINNRTGGTAGSCAYRLRIDYTSDS